MNTLFLVQFACCIIVSMLGLILVLSRFQIRWTNRRYEVSRWLLAFSMFVLAWHYVLQMVCGFRAKGDEIGAVVNVLFYSPVSFFISYATYNLICYRGGREKFALLGCVSYALILICFFFGYNDTPRGMHMGEWLYVMLALFALPSCIALIPRLLRCVIIERLPKKTPRKTCFLLIDIPIPLTDWRV